MENKIYPNNGMRKEKNIFYRSFKVGELRSFGHGRKIFWSDLSIKINIEEVDLSTEVIFSFKDGKKKILKVGNTKQTNNLIDVSKYKTLSISGNSFGMFGQIKSILLSEDFRPAKGFNVKRFKEIWDLHHLNDLTPGTLKQEETLNKWKERPKGFSYDEDCKYLKSKKLYTDRGYKYGSKWLIKELPQGIEEEIKNIIDDIKEDSN